MRFWIFAFIAFLYYSPCFAGKPAPLVSNIVTDKAPAPLGAYSQATQVDARHGKLLYISGQIASDPKTGKLHEGDIKTATRVTMNNIEALLKAAGSDWKYVVNMEVFLKDFNDWDGMNEEYAKRFPNKQYPARHTVQVGMENRIEIACVALIPAD